MFAFQARLEGLVARGALVVVLGLAMALPLGGCLDIQAPTPSRFPCPDGQCPSGFSCSADAICVPQATTGGGSSAGVATTGGAPSPSPRGGTGTSASSSSGGSSSGASSGTSANGSSSGASSGSASSGGVTGNFAGEWDMSFSHVSLTEEGGLVTGKYRDWGYPFSDPTNAGTIAGTVVGNVFQGTFQDNALDPAGSLNWTLSSGELSGIYQNPGQPSYPWCGVAAGQGTPLPKGCGWSDAFLGDPTNGTIAYVLTQIGDEVSGTYGGGKVSGGVVTGLHVNLQYAKTGATFIGRFSLWMTPDGTQVSGNYVYAGNGPHTASCAVRSGSAAQLPTPCLGGGGFFDGTWFTNFGTVTLTQPQPSNSPVTGIWFGWGSEVEYTIDGGASGLAGGGPPSAYSLSWTDDSPLGGAVGMTTVPTTNANMLQGRTAFQVDGGGDALWCGVSYGPDPFAMTPLPDAGKTGSLFPGCGLTSSSWVLWQPPPGDPNPASSSAQLVQDRGTVRGSTEIPPIFEVSGSLAFTPPGDAAGDWIVATGSWANPPNGDAGVFAWYTDLQEQTFSGDFSLASFGAPDAGAWCGSVLGALPNPCLH